MATIAYIDDDEIFGKALVRALRGLGWGVDWFRSPTEALHVTGSGFQCILLDWIWPDDSGPGLCEAFRARVPNAGIVVVTGCVEAATMLTAFRSGADDFLTKERDILEFDARIHNVLWRRELQQAERRVALPPGFLRWESVRLDLLNHRLHVDPRAIDLSPTETRTLALLMVNQIRGGAEPVPKDSLVASIFSVRPADPGNSLRVLMSNLRRKLRACGVDVVRSNAGYSLRCAPAVHAGWAIT